MRVPLFVGTLLITSAALAAPTHQDIANTPTTVAAAYLDAMESGNLNAAEKLFGRSSSIYESGGQEGSWIHYRNQHLGPEIEAVESFTISRGEVESLKSRDGSMAFVAWPIDYRILLKDDGIIESNGTVTFVLVDDGDGYRIRHLHWSSRKKKVQSERD